MAAQRVRPLLVSTVALMLAAIGMSASTSYGAKFLPSIFGTGQPKPGPYSSQNYGKAPTRMEKLGSAVGGTFSGMKNAVSNTTKKAGQLVKPKADPAASDRISLASGTKEGPELFISVARLQERAGNLDGAVEQYRRALEVDASNLPARLGLARLYDRRGNLTEAAEEYREAVRRHPNDPTPLNDLGLCYARQAKFGDAIETFRRCVEMAPDKPLYRNNLATVMVELGQNREALEQLTVVHGRAAGLYNLGFLLNKRGQKQIALEHFRQALAVDPSFEAARRWSQALESELNMPATGPGPSQSLALAPSSPAPSNLSAPVTSPAPMTAPAPAASAVGPRYASAPLNMAAPAPVTSSMQNPVRYQGQTPTPSYRSEPVSAPPVSQPPVTTNNGYPPNPLNVAPAPGAIRPLPPLSATTNTLR